MKSAFKKEIITYIEGLNLDESTKPINPSTCCFNCESKKQVKQCLLCNSYFCHFCYVKYRSASKTSHILCFGCRFNVLTKLSLYQEELENRPNYNLDLGKNIISEPNWSEITPETTCSWCGKNSSKFVCCGLCGHYLCKECNVAHDSGRPIFKNPSIKTTSQKQTQINHLCRPCNYILHSGVRIDYGKVDRRTFVNTLRELVESIKPPEKLEAPKKQCSHCERKNRKSVFCVTCGIEYCKNCVQYFILPRKFAVLKQTKKNLEPVCYSCRNQILESNGKLHLINVLHNCSNIDYEQQKFLMPTWQNPKDIKYCNSCLDSLSKKFTCNMCGDVNCKKCVMQIEDPQDVFFNPFDIYHFNMCFECRFYKISGFQMQNEKIVEKNDTEEINSNIKILFEETFDLKNEVVIDSFNCFRKKSILILGKMFVTKTRICFRPQQMYNEESLMIDLSAIKSFKMFGIIKNQFQITIDDAENNPTNIYYFSFVYVFSAQKHLKFLESLVKENGIEFEKCLKLKQMKKSLSSSRSLDNISVDSFEILKDVELETILEYDYPVNSNEIFDYAFDDNATYSLKHFNEEEGNIENEYTPWKLLEPEKGLNSREFSMKFKVFGVPSFMKTSDYGHLKRYEFMLRNSTSFAICSKVEITDVVYSDHFNVFLYFFAKDTDNGCTLKVKYSLKFIKSAPFIQGKIKKKSLEEYHNTLDRFFKKVMSKFTGEEVADVKEDNNEIEMRFLKLEERLKFTIALVVCLGLIILILFVERMIKILK